MEFKLETLTPLWTGGVKTGQMDRIQETGIIGGLRWWYEAVLRGLVGTGQGKDHVCDPTGESGGRCNYESRGWVCPACDLFGATGWKRRFRFEVKEGGERLFNSAEKINIRIGTQSWNNGWYFASPFISPPNKSIGAEITVLRNRAFSKSSTENDLRIVTSLINKWGGLGTKTQHGFGVVRLKLGDEDLLDVDAFLSGLTDNNQDQGFPTLGNMFFARLHFQGNPPDKWWGKATLGKGVSDKIKRKDGTEIDHTKAWRLDQGFAVPSGPAVKYKLRYGKDGKSYLSEADKCARYFFGDEKAKPPIKAKLNISNAYKNDTGKWEFRIWGWFPTQDLPNGVNRNQIVAELHELVTNPVKCQKFWDSIFGVGVIDLSKSEWREKDASGHGRNTKDAAGNVVAPATTADFLKCLLS